MINHLPESPYIGQSEKKTDHQIIEPSGRLSVRLSIEGMTCKNCAAGVEKRLQAAEGIKSATVDFPDAAATIEYDPMATAPEKWQEALSGTRYKLTGIIAEKEPKIAAGGHLPSSTPRAEKVPAHSSSSILPATANATDQGSSQVTMWVRGMTCAGCSASVSKRLAALDGVISATVNLNAETASVTYDPQKTAPAKWADAFSGTSYSLTIKQQAADVQKRRDEKRKDLVKKRRQAMLGGIATGLMVIIMIAEMFGGMGDASGSAAILPFIQFILASIVMLGGGMEYLKAIGAFFRHGEANMNTLIGFGTGTAYIHSTIFVIFGAWLPAWANSGMLFFDAVVAVVGLVSVGKYFESKAKLKTGDAVEELFKLQEKTCLLLKNGEAIEFPTADLQPGDVILVKPGARIPIDGVVCGGESHVNESSLTGEPLPVWRKVGDVVSSGTLNEDSVLKIEAQRVGSETLLARVIAMVEQAQATTPDVQRLADKVSAVFVPVILVVASLSFAGWLLIGGQYLPIEEAFGRAIQSLVAVLVIACPCALGLATPAAISAGIGRGAAEGILIKDALALEVLGQADTLLTDKTGTLTQGVPQLTQTVVSVSSMDERQVLELACALERLSAHPLARAIVKRADELDVKVVEAESFKSITGQGVQGEVSGRKLFCGSLEGLRATSWVGADEIERLEVLADDAALKGGTIVVLADEKGLLAEFIITDAVKPEAQVMVRDLSDKGLAVILLTGDRPGVARYVAEQVGISADNIHAGLMPQGKWDIIDQHKRAGRTTVMLGDGVNDAPALARAHVGIAMGTGSDAALDAAGIILLKGSLDKATKAITLARLTMAKIRQNLFWAFVYNVVGIPLAAGLLYPFTGLMLNPAYAGAAMAFSSVSVVANSLLLRAAKL